MPSCRAQTPKASASPKPSSDAQQRHDERLGHDRSDQAPAAEADRRQDADLAGALEDVMSSTFAMPNAIAMKTAA